MKKKIFEIINFKKYLNFSKFMYDKIPYKVSSL